MYLIDNNVLSHLSLSQRASRFFLEQCRVPSEVIREAGGLDAAGLSKGVEYPTTARVLNMLRDVMATVPVGDTTFVNLYANKGSADPLLIACALDAIHEGEQLLVAPTWIVVSNDNAVLSKASEFGIETRTREQFVEQSLESWEAGPNVRNKA
jgi:hypothetical protein